LAVEGLLLEMVAALTRSASIPQDGPVWLRRVEDLLRSRFSETITLGELAEEAGVHPIYLASVFRKRFGCSVGEFVRQLRVDRAATLLAHPRTSLAEIAFLTGFADQSHFTRIFKRATGLTPAAYRQAFLA
jgi:AraC family transcriptional regulator